MIHADAKAETFGSRATDHDLRSFVESSLGTTVDELLRRPLAESTSFPCEILTARSKEQSVELFDQLSALQALGRPVLVGPSRKRFLGEVTGLPVEDRDRATAAACALAWERGARLFRVHAVAAAGEALALAHALDASLAP